MRALNTRGIYEYMSTVFRINTTLILGYPTAEVEGFEPPVRVSEQQFSRLPHSTALAHLQWAGNPLKLDFTAKLHYISGLTLFYILTTCTA